MCTAWTPDVVAPAVERVATALALEGIALRVLAGGEIAPSRLDRLDDETLLGLALGGGRHLLVECPFTPFAALEPVVADLHARGHSVVLAHPERSPGMRRDPGQLVRLAEMGALLSVTDGSLDGRFGETVRRIAFTLLREGMVHNLASDTHDTHRRPPDLGAGLRRASRELRNLAEQRGYLTEAVPAAVLSGEPLPPAPAPISSRSRLAAALRR